MIEQLNTFNEKDIKNKKGNINKLINDSTLEKIIEFIKYCIGLKKSNTFVTIAHYFDQF